MPLCLASSICCLAESGSAVSIVGWSLVLIALIVVGFLAVTKLREWLKSDDDIAPVIGFTLSDLRELHRQGKMTDEEFERARSKMVTSAKAMADKLPDPLARNRRGPDQKQPRQQP